MSDIPRARRSLAAMADDLPAPFCDQIRDILPLLDRRALVKPKGLPKGRRIDAAAAAAIRAYCAAHPGAHLQDVAVLFGTNSGRVSEALHHDR